MMTAYLFARLKPFVGGVYFASQYRVMSEPHPTRYSDGSHFALLLHASGGTFEQAVEILRANAEMVMPEIAAKVRL